MSDTFSSLSRHEGSWIATNLRDGRVYELQSECAALSAHRSQHWKIETIGTYLGRINQAIKNQA